MEDSKLLEKANDCLRLESEAIEMTRGALGGSFVKVIRLINDTISSGNKLIFSGVGKNEPICEKIKATFNSTGVNAVYLDPLKAVHGDLGICASGDLAFLFSNGGMSEEMLALDAFLRRLGVITIAYTAEEDSALAQSCNHVITYSYGDEACPLDLAPTASTTAALALGDAIAMVLLELRGFTKEDFAKFHPSGRLGKSLLLRVSEVMRKGDRIAVVEESSRIETAIQEITRARCGIAAIVEPENSTLVGVFSDGDFRRAAMKESEVLQTSVSNYMTRDPICVLESALAVEVLRLFQEHRINDMIVINKKNQPVGLIDGQDLPNLKLV